MKKKNALSLMALVFALAAPVAALAQPPKVAAWAEKSHAQLNLGMVRSSANQCRIDAFYGHGNSAPCQRINSPVARQIVMDANMRIQAADLILFGIPTSRWGVGDMRWSDRHGGAWFEFGRDGRWSNDRFGKFDDAELWGTVIHGAGSIYAERNRHGEEMERIRMQDKHTPDADVPVSAQTQTRTSSTPQPQVVEVRVVHDYPASAPQTQSAPTTTQQPATSPSSVTTVINGTRTDVRMERPGRNDLILSKGTTIDVVFAHGERVDFTAEGCDVNISEGNGNTVILSCN